MIPRSILIALGCAACIAGAVAAPGAASAQTYTWTDANGDEHFTDDVQKVPEPHRQKYMDQINTKRRSKAEAEEEGVRRARENAFNTEMRQRTGREAAFKSAHGRAESERHSAPSQAPEQTPKDKAPSTGGESRTRAAFSDWKGPSVELKAIDDELEERRNRERRERDKKHIHRIIADHRQAIGQLREELDKVRIISPVHTDIEARRQRWREEMKRLNEEIEYWEEILRNDY